MQTRWNTFRSSPKQDSSLCIWGFMLACREGNPPRRCTPFWNYLWCLCLFCHRPGTTRCRDYRRTAPVTSCGPDGLVSGGSSRGLWFINPMQTLYGVLQNWVYHFGGLTIRTIVYWSLYWGPPCFGKLPHPKSKALQP